MDRKFSKTDPRLAGSTTRAAMVASISSVVGCSSHPAKAMLRRVIPLASVLRRPPVRAALRPGVIL